MNIIDILQESGAPTILYHYTNFSSLLKILKSGYLKLSRFPVTSSHKKYPFELATVRPSARNYKPYELSPGAKNVKFIIKADILRDKVRSIKVKPIAEFSLNSINNIKKTIGKYTDLVKKENLDKIANEIIKEALKIYHHSLVSNYQKSKSESYANKKMSEFLIKKFGEDEIKKADKKLYRGGFTPLTFNILGNTETIYKFMKKREGEERIAGPQKIPLDNKYLKIELETVAIYTFRLEDKQLIEKWESLFVKNKTYEKIKKRFSKEFSKGGLDKKENKI